MARSRMELPGIMCYPSEPITIEKFLGIKDVLECDSFIELIDHDYLDDDQVRQIIANDNAVTPVALSTELFVIWWRFELDRASGNLKAISTEPFEPVMRFKKSDEPLIIAEFALCLQEIYYYFAPTLLSTYSTERHHFDQKQPTLSSLEWIQILAPSMLAPPHSEEQLMALDGVRKLERLDDGGIYLQISNRPDFSWKKREALELSLGIKADQDDHPW